MKIEFKIINDYSQEFCIGQIWMRPNDNRPEDKIFKLVVNDIEFISEETKKKVRCTIVALEVGPSCKPKQFEKYQFFLIDEFFTNYRLVEERMVEVGEPVRPTSRLGEIDV